LVAASAMAALTAVRPFAQEQQPVPAFPTQAEAITVDVVVVDKDGHPVKGLEKSDFTLLEDGHPQTISAFEPRFLEPLSPEKAAAETLDTGVATNETPTTTGGRTLAFLVDDIGIEPVHMTYVAKALAEWLATKADPRDEVTLLTTSGDAWWSDEIGRGREDLLAVLGRIKGRKDSSDARDWISDWEALRIDTYEDATGARLESAGPGAAAPQMGPPTTPPPTDAGHGPGDILGRVVTRWGANGACNCGAKCEPCVQARAREVLRASSRRTQTVLSDIEQLSRGLAGSRGRKSIVIVSDGFIRDPQMAAFDRAIDASQRGNTAAYFIDARALEGPSGYGANLAVPIEAGDVALMGMEHQELEVGGTSYIASATGGTTIHNTNDLLGGLERVADESSAYYLLGYQPDRSANEKWHKLEVKVDRKGVTVRARRGYSAAPAPTPGASAPAKTKKGEPKAPTRALDPAATVAATEDAIPVRMAPYLLEADAQGMIRVLVALEVDTSKLTFESVGDMRKTALDLTLVGVSRDKGKLFPVDERLQMEMNAKAVGGWFTFSRELRLPAGVAQVRALVREVSSHHAGAVAERLEIPVATQPRLSTPLLTDRLETLANGQKRLDPVAHRLFAPRGSLYCAFSAYGLADSEGRATLKVTGAYTLQAVGGPVVSASPPTVIAVGLEGAVTRTLVLPLDSLAAGDYDLTLDVIDNVSGRSLTDKTRFSVEPIKAATKGE
jgi:VWFA-related protein